MCGRYMLTPVDALRQLFLFKERPNLPPRYNIAPTQDVPIVRRTRREAGRELIMVRWGLVPYWAADPKIGNRLINALRKRGAHRGVPRGAYQRRRCLVPADGFFEWQKDGTTRRPLLVRRRDQAPFAFAGLWERCPQPGGAVLLVHHRHLSRQRAGRTGARPDAGDPRARGLRALARPVPSGRTRAAQALPGN